MSTCGEPCDGCPNRAEHHLCDACCHDEVNAIRREERELREKLEWQAACTKALMESQERLAAELKEARAEVERLRLDLADEQSRGRFLDEQIGDVSEDAYQRGAEAMREAAAHAVEGWLQRDDVEDYDDAIRALPLPEDK